MQKSIPTGLLFFLILFTSSIQEMKGQLNAIDLEIPMRDSLSLAADLYLPDETGEFPVILIQTPYGKFFYEISGLPLGIGMDIQSSNYAVVIVDWRCRFESISACAVGSDNGEDGYDVVEWIAEQDWCNGMIGTWGPSALGNVQYQTAQEQPEHLVCCVPEVANPYETITKYYPGGSIALAHLETLQILFGAYDIVIANPYDNLLWTIAENSTMYPSDITVPMLLVGGWYDHNTYWNFQMMDTLQSSSAEDVQDLHKMIIGPWVHGGTGQAQVGTSIQGELEYPEAESFSDLFAMEFFDYYLRGIDNEWNERNRYSYFQMGDNEWLESEVWPPANLETKTFYFHGDGSLDETSPQSEFDLLSFEYDPEDPSPTVGGKTLNLQLDQGPYDQGPEVESRDDILVFTTAPFQDDLRVKGTIKFNLWVYSDVIDTDFAVRLTEVYPDDRSMLLEDALLRMRFREGYSVQDTSFMNPGEVYPITIEIDPLATTFKAGQRLRVDITSSNYPMWNRNMNTGGEMYPDSNIDTLVNPLVANNTVMMTNSFPSHIEIPVELSTNLSSASLVSDIVIFPNPTTDIISIQNHQKGSEIRVIDSLGRLVLSKILLSGKDQLSMQKLTSGIYHVQIFNLNKLVHLDKIFVQH